MVKKKESKRAKAIKEAKAITDKKSYKDITKADEKARIKAENTGKLGRNIKKAFDVGKVKQNVSNSFITPSKDLKSDKWKQEDKEILSEFYESLSSSEKLQLAKKKGGTQFSQFISESNEAFEELLRNAGTELSPISKTERNTFYRLTQNLWENKKADYRNQYIMSATGFKTLEGVYNYIMSQVEGDIPTEEFEEGGTPSELLRLKPLVFRK